MSSGNDGARKKKKIEKFPPFKISKRLRDRPTFHVGGSSSQAVIPSYPQQETLSTVNMAMYPPSVSSSISAPFPSYSSQGTFPTVEGLPSFTWENSTQTYVNSFNKLWP